MDTKRVESIVIGTGITGSIILRTLGAIGLDKAQRSGGRCSSGRIGSSYKYDKGATFLKKQVTYKLSGKERTFSLEKFLTRSGIKLELVAHPTHPDLVSVKSGMVALVEKIISNQNINYSTKVLRIEKLKNEFLIKCEDIQFLSPLVFCTCPLPQTFALLEEGDLKERWEKFTTPYLDYKKTLVFTAFWEESKIKDSNFSEISQLNHGEDIEYYTIESEKAGKNPYLILSIQFSENFSEMHFDNWTDHEKYPNEFSMELGLKALEKIFYQNGMNFVKPDDLRIHRWKFAAPKLSVFNKDEQIDFDSKIFKQYMELCKQSSFVPIGDWVFGQRVTKCIPGTLVFLNLLGYSPELEEEILT